MSKNISPLLLRLSNRKNEEFLRPTYGCCPGYFQANISMIPSDYAEKFRKFCSLNSSFCPVVYESKRGEFQCPLLADDSDIRTDLSAYQIIKDGKVAEKVSNLLHQDWTYMSTYYLGCSFSFDDKLIEAGIKLDFSSNVSMFKTNIDCAPVAPFSGKAIVSMRPIPKHLLQKAFEATVNCDFCHGAPVHIGRPEDIGINKQNTVDFGSNVNIKEDEVPVFWACGVTAIEALLNANLYTAYTHSPGCMFVSDTPSTDIPKKLNNVEYSKPKVFCLDKVLNRYSVLSEHSYSLLTEIEEVVSADIGNRGIANLHIPGELHKAVLSLSKEAKAVAILLGFRCFTEGKPKEENDGVAGAIILARALVKLGIHVTFFIDAAGEVLKETLLECNNESLIGGIISVRNLSKDFNNNLNAVLFDPETGTAIYTHLIAIERPSRSITGKYCTMTGRDISQECDELDKLFELAENCADIVTIGIGDGGNEVGMGKVKDKVAKYITNGDIIAAKTSCDHLLVCGVSDWGGYALSAGLLLARNCLVHDRYRRFGIGHHTSIQRKHDFFLTKEKDYEMRKLIKDRGFRDGISKEASFSVDNLSYEDVHLPKILKMQEIALSSS